LDGTGNSGVVLDLNMAQHLVIDFLALKVGVFRVHMLTSKGYIKILEVSYTNSVGTAYIPTATLPLRFQIRTKGIAPLLVSSLKMICCNYESENGDPIRRTLGERFVVHDNGIPALSSLGIETPILSIRPKLLQNGKTFRGIIIPENIKLFSVGKEFKWIIRLNGILTGAIWTPHIDIESSIEFDTTSTVITGGRIISVGFSDKKDSKDISDAFDKIFLSLNADATIGDVLTLSVIALNANSSIYYSLGFKEIK